MHIAVIGGGLSGIRAALSLARAGVRTTLFEKNRHLGGRVFSFTTPDFGEVDIGQHIWLRACTAFEALLRDLEVPDTWIYRQDRVAMTYRWPDGHTRHLAAGRLPGSAGMLPFLLGARLTRLDKLKHVWGVLRARAYSAAALERLDDVPFAAWLRAQHQPPAVIEWFWEPFVMGVCNGRLSEVSARHGLFAVRESLLKSPQAAAICFFRRPLSQVFDRHARQVLQKAGVDVRTGCDVREIHNGVPVELRTGPGQERFDRVILALPLRRMRQLLPGVVLPTPAREGAIAGLLLRFARPVMQELFFSGVGSPVQIVFNKTAIWNQEPADGSQVIEIVTSAAEREVRLGAEKVAAELLPALGHLLPAVATTPVLGRRLLVHGTATFRVSPDRERQRLKTRVLGLPSVLFAGDFAATGWPSTMESAVPPGELAADLAQQA